MNFRTLVSGFMYDLEKEGFVYPKLASNLLFVEEDGIIFLALPGQDVERLSRSDSLVCKMCTGGSELNDIVRSYAEIQGIQLAAAFNEVFDLLQDLERRAFIEVCPEISLRPLESWRLGVRSMAELESAE